MNRRLKSAVTLAVVLLTACASASADTGIKIVLAALESRYGMHHHGVPGLWLAKPFLLASGMGSLKMAQFEDFHPPAEEDFAVKQVVEKALGPDWSPFVETRSKSDGEWALMLAKTTTAGDGMQILIVSSDHDDGLTVLQVSVSGRVARLWLDEPAESAKNLTGGRIGEGDKGTAEMASGRTNSHSETDVPGHP